VWERPHNAVCCTRVLLRLYTHTIVTKLRMVVVIMDTTTWGWLLCVMASRSWPSLRLRSTWSNRRRTLLHRTPSTDCSLPFVESVVYASRSPLRSLLKTTQTNSPPAPEMPMCTVSVCGGRRRACWGYMRMARCDPAGAARRSAAAALRR